MVKLRFQFEMGLSAAVGFEVVGIEAVFLAVLEEIMEEGKAFVLRSQTKQKTHHSFIIIIIILFCSAIQVRIMTFIQLFFTRKS